jgi:serine/threonine-protein kinase
MLKRLQYLGVDGTDPIITNVRTVAESGGTMPQSRAPAGAMPDSAPMDTIDTTVLQLEYTQTRLGALRALLASLCITSAILVVLSDGSWPARLLVGAFLGNALFVGVLLIVAKRRGYGDSVSAAVGVSVSLLPFACGAWLGLDSALMVALPSLVYYFGFGDSKLRRRAVLFVVVVGYTLLLSAMLFELIPPQGMLYASNPELRYSKMVVGGSGAVVLQILALTYWLARKTRGSTLDAMVALERARRDIRQRDALLQEVNANFDRVLEGARLGRHSGHTLGPFQVHQVLGRGAIGEVYDAIDSRNGKSVALKVLHAHLEASSGHAQRFHREVQIVGALRSPHVPAFVESGVDADGAPFLAMERLEGTDLATELRHKKRLRLEEVDELVAQTARALEAAHAAGVVHRDIKPQNLFCVRGEGRPLWKVLDFGVSKLMSGGGTLTRDAAVGTPAYMAPEQVVGAEVDGRADVFALAAVVYRALTGHPAFGDASEVVTMLRVSRTQPVRPGELVRLEPDVDALLALALAKDVEDRIPSPAAFAQAWRAARANELPPDLRAAAKRLLDAQPWGSDVEERTRVLARGVAGS